MNKLLKWVGSNFDKLYIIFLFFISYLIALYFFPGERKFRYEYQKGQPWMHEDLNAPFDFAIYKTDKEIGEEKKELLDNFSPYFTRSEEIMNKELNSFRAEFDIKLKRYKAEYDSLKKEKQNKNLPIYQPDSLKRYYNRVLELLGFIYESGIIEYEEGNWYNGKAPETIWILNHKIASEVKYSTVFTLESAYNYVLKNTGTEQINFTTIKSQDFFRDFEINKFINPNLFYDKATSDKILTDQIENLSATRGLVREGENIIRKGETVDTERFRKLESFKKVYLSSLSKSASHSLLFLGRFIIVLFGFLTLYLFLNRFREYVLNSRRKTIFILMLVVSSILLSNIINHFNILSIYLIPFIIVPILVNTFYESRLALFVHMITVFMTSFYAPNNFEFIFIQFFAGVIAIIGLKTIQKRGQFFGSAILTVLSYFILYLGFSLNREGDLKSIEWINFGWFAGNGVLILLSFPMVYVFEKTFRFISDITLMELSDTNQDLLRTLAEKAPGTFQHSIQVANLAEEVIRSIGGNSLLVRTGALYHDIGKLANPQYFTENQIQGTNPHIYNDYKDSAAIIIDHVIIGYEMAKKAKLPKPIIDFILTHHGTTKTQYFYRLYKKEHPEDKHAVTFFTYPGPKPFTKETAVLMMADAIEASSRSLKEYSFDLLEELVENIIDFQIEEKQFDNAPITFAEIGIAKNIFKNKLKNIYHPRIEYPKEEE
ncbi:MAG: HDIG domain-containing protein [Bacteroidales bacterium]